VNYVLRYKYWALLSTLLWLMASWAGVHGHYCFDGQEPPISIHLDNIDTHEEHDADSAHVDMDIDLSQSVVAKLLKFDATLALLLVAVFVFLVLPQSALFFPVSQTAHPRRIVGLRPPPRAPPVTPA
tara:strand:+ start:790 stop:1170 length:381 start_codon:yes stop_codon:yes gene_type:complete